MKYAGIFTILILTACSTTQRENFVAELESIDLATDLRRAYADAYQDQPFADGSVSVVATESGRLRSFELSGCRNGQAICGSSGRVGHAHRTPDYVVVMGAYAGRTFYLSPGGDGVLVTNGEATHLAWE